MTEKGASSGWRLLNEFVQLVGLVAVLSGLWRATARVDKVEKRQDAAEQKHDALAESVKRTQQAIKERAIEIQRQNDAQRSDEAHY